jgi:hypothetical protein
MKIRKNKKRRVFGVFGVLIYMNNQKQTKKRKIRWFSVTRILVLLWNFGTLWFHIYVINMTSTTGIVQHIIGMITEYLIAGIYENSIVRINKLINQKTKNSKNKFKKVFIKYIAFSVIFVLTYTLIYALRMLAFYLVGYDLLTLEKFKIAIITNLLFAFTVSPFLAIVAINTRDKVLKVKIEKRL